MCVCLGGPLSFVSTCWFIYVHASCFSYFSVLSALLIILGNVYAAQQQAISLHSLTCERGNAYVSPKDFMSNFPFYQVE